MDTQGNPFTPLMTHLTYIIEMELNSRLYATQMSAKDGKNGYYKPICGNRTEGYQFSVLVIRRQHSNYSLSEFSDEVFDSWGFGDSIYGNEALLFVRYDCDSSYDNVNIFGIRVHTGNKMHVSMGKRNKENHDQTADGSCPQLSSILG